MGEGRAGRATGTQTRRWDFIQWMMEIAATYANQSKKTLARGLGMYFYRLKSRSVFWKRALRCRSSVTAISSDSSSVLSGEECEKGLPLLSPTELLLQRVIWTSGVSPRAAGCVPSFLGSCIVDPAPVPALFIKPIKSSPHSCRMWAHQSTWLRANGAAREEVGTPVPAYYLS